ncbi:MAG TPA: hypothetical protein VGC66_17795 [Pyrinomonadaceae bacterium]
MEKVSEHTMKQKRRGGRPRLKLFEPKIEETFEGLGVYDGSGTERNRQNWMYRQRAICLLNVIKDKRYKWLFDTAKVQAGAPRAEKMSILAELGRIQDPDIMRAVALCLCEEKPTTRDAVHRIRRFRTGKRSEGNVRQLEYEIRNLVADYLNRHPEMLFSRACDALASALNHVAELAQKQE